MASQPAAMARTAPATRPISPVMAPMSMPSLIRSPLNPSSPLRRSVRIGRLRVAGATSIDGTTTCAVMTARTPAAIAASNGASAPRRGSSAATGSTWWESWEVSPWPGKCLTQAATPAPWRPLTKATVCSATRSGSAPKERTPITGLAGLLLTSASGARSRSTPARARTAPIEAATDRVSSTSPAKPRARLPG